MSTTSRSTQCSLFGPGVTLFYLVACEVRSCHLVTLYNTSSHLHTSNLYDNRSLIVGRWLSTFRPTYDPKQPLLLRQLRQLHSYYLQSVC
jgi:hypothetical protein